MRWLHTIISLAILSLSVVAKGQDSLSVAERNAAQGFNDTIDRLARTEKQTLRNPELRNYVIPSSRKK